MAIAFILVNAETFVENEVMKKLKDIKEVRKLTWLMEFMISSLALRQIVCVN